MTIKEFSKQFRETGVWTLGMELLELKYIEDNIYNWYRQYEDQSLKQKEEGFSLENYIDIEIGMWEAKHGFTLTCEQVFGRERMKKLEKKLAAAKKKRDSK